MKSPDAAGYLLARLVATLLLGVLCFVIGFYVGEQRGYKIGKEHCKPTARKLLSEMSKREIHRWARYLSQREGALK